MFTKIFRMPDRRASFSFGEESVSEPELDFLYGKFLFGEIK